MSAVNVLCLLSVQVGVRRLVPAFNSMYGPSESRPTMVLVLDNAPYHHKESAGCVNVNSLNKLSPSQAQQARGDNRTLVSVAEEHNVQSLTVRRDGQLVEIPREQFQQRGTISVVEFRLALKQWLRRNKPGVLRTQLEEMAHQHDFELVFTPPYCPQFQPIELLWRDSKNFVAREWFTKRSPDRTAKDLMDFWFGTPHTSKRQKVQPAYGPAQALRHIGESHNAINEWIATKGLRLSGELTDLSYDANVQYPDDGSLLFDDDTLEDSVQSDSDIDADD